MIFTTMTLSEMSHVMAIRSLKDSLFTIGPFSNRAMVITVLGTTLLQILVLYVPFFQNLLGTMALPLRDLIIAMIASTWILWAVELQKWLQRRSARGAQGAAAYPAS
jgi:Ca2+-transporting ATPase